MRRPSFRDALKMAALGALVLAMAIPPVYGQTTGAGVAVVSVDDGAIMGANGIDGMIPANLAGRLGFALLAHTWMDETGTDPNEALPGGDPGLTLGIALPRLLLEGRDGEMARALIAARIGYTPANLNQAMAALMAEVGTAPRGVEVQRGAWGGPEWTGAISTRDTARLAVALARVAPTATDGVAAGAGLQCMAGAVGTNGARWISVVSGALSPEGCIAAARSSIDLTDTRVAEAIRPDKP